MMDAVRSCVEYPFEWYQINVIVDTDCPKASYYTMGQDEIDWEGYEVATSKDGYGLKECIDWMECKA